MTALILSALLLGPGADDKAPEPRLPLGKGTTFVTGPLDKRGYVDYESALNAELSKGVTPETNANVALLGVLGPTPEGGELRPGVYKWLDVAAPPKDGEYIVGVGKFARDQLRLTQEQSDALDEFMAQAPRRAWAAHDCPPLVEWLRASEKPLARVHEAVERPEYFNPLVSKRTEDDPSNLSGAPLPTVQKCRGLALALAARATLRLGEKKYDEAWADILACHRLGRLLTRGASLIEALVGYAVCRLASDATVAYVERADLTAKQARARWAELDALPPVAPLADKIHLAERMMALDALQLVRRGDPSGFYFAFERPGKPTKEEMAALERLDWASAMQAVNAWYDRLAAAMRLKDRAARETAFDAIDKELAEVRKKAGGADDFPLAAFMKLVATKGADKVIGKTTGDVYASLAIAPIRRVQSRRDALEQGQRNLRVAFALAAYRADTGRYPAKLADLAPDYLPAVPDDVFGGKPLIYKPVEKGYLFYSVGIDGKDDEGRGPTDAPPGDDLAVRVPVPEPKKK
jgi:hypothetical protein